MGLGDFISDIFGSEQQAPEGAYYGGKKGFAEEETKRLQAQRAAAANRATPETNWRQADSDYLRSQVGANQMQSALGQASDATGLARQAAMGQAPSVAALQQQQGLADAQRQAQSMAASARGGGANLAAAQRAAMRSQESMAGNAVNAAAQLRAQEMAQARGQFGQMAAQQGQLASDYTGAMDRSRGLSQGQAQFDTQTSLAAQAQRDAQERFWEEQSAGVHRAQLGADMQQRGFEANAAAANAKTNNDNTMGLLKMGAGAAMMASDVRVKTDVKPAGAAPGGDDWSKATGLASAANQRFDDERAAENQAFGEAMRDAQMTPYERESAHVDKLIADHTRSQEEAAKAKAEQEHADNEAAMQRWQQKQHAWSLNAPESGGGGGGHPALGAFGATQGEGEKLPPTMSPMQQMGMQLMMSDRDSKRSKERSNASEVAASMRPYSYEYRDPERFGDGRRLGIMAQDLEKTPLGREMVEDTPRGKAIDLKALASGLAAIAGDHEARLRKAEKGGRRGRV